SQAVRKQGLRQRAIWTTKRNDCDQFAPIIGEYGQRPNGFDFIWLATVGTSRTSRREPGPALAAGASSGRPRAACGPHRPPCGLDSPLGACAWSSSYLWVPSEHHANMSRPTSVAAAP